jgi:hypothetical protein
MCNLKDNLADAVATYESTITEKESEIKMLRQEVLDLRTAMRREQSLMVAAWHDLSMSIQANSSGSINYGTPSSWLALQRKQVLHKAR